MPNEKPNILVIWGDDIGITNLSCYSDGLMGYRTPNIDRIANEGMRFTDSYGQQSCTAGRAAFITGQNPYRIGLTKVGMPGADIGLQAEDATIAELLKPLGYATGQFGKNHFGDKNKYLPTAHGFDEFFGNLYHLNAEEEPENVDYPTEADFPNSKRSSARAASCIPRPPRKTIPPSIPLGACRQAEDRGHRPADQEAHGDVRHRVRGGGARLHQTSPRGRAALLCLVQHHLDALPRPPAGACPRPGRALAVLLPRRHGGTRQARGADAGPAGRAGHRRGHHRHVHDRQRPAHEHLARRRHDALPQREELQLGRRLPRAGAGALAGQDQGG